MPQWYYDKSELLESSPSAKDGVPQEVERLQRKEGARFIIDIGSRMGLTCDSMASGVVFFHRFYLFHSFKEFPPHATACAALFLAGKVEETPKRCKDVIKAARAIDSERGMAAFGVDATDARLQEEIMTLERILLHTIKFDLQVEHPYTFLLTYAKSLRGDRNKLQKLVQMTWTFANDSLCTTLCLQWEPEIIAIALMYLAGKLLKFEVVDWVGREPSHLRWWDMYADGITLDILEDICHQVLDVYSHPVGVTKLEMLQSMQPGPANSPDQKRASRSPGKKSPVKKSPENVLQLTLDQKMDRIPTNPTSFAPAAASYNPERFPTPAYPYPPPYAAAPRLRGPNSPPLMPPAGLPHPGPFHMGFPTMMAPSAPFYPPQIIPPNFPFTASPGPQGPFYRTPP